MNVIKFANLILNPFENYFTQFKIKSANLISIDLGGDAPVTRKMGLGTHFVFSKISEPS